MWKSYYVLCRSLGLLNVRRILIGLLTPHLSKDKRSYVWRPTKCDSVHLHLLRVLLCALGDAQHIPPQRPCVFVSVQGEKLGIRQPEYEPAPNLCHRLKPSEGGVVEPLHKLKGLVHTVIDWVTAVSLRLLDAHTHMHTHLIIMEDHLDYEMFSCCYVYSIQYVHSL